MLLVCPRQDSNLLRATPGVWEPDAPSVPSAGFEPALPAPEADALSPELRGRGTQEHSPVVLRPG